MLLIMFILAVRSANEHWGYIVPGVPYINMA